MSETNVYVTIETFNKMREELQRMKSVDRPAASRAIAEAREKGDLKENAEYDSAKEAQGMLEAKIKQLEATISNAKIVDTSTIDTSKVTILTKVTITNIATKKTVTYLIVGEKEADLKLGKISASSPTGVLRLIHHLPALMVLVSPSQGFPHLTFFTTRFFVTSRVIISCPFLR